jgi:hypothetical protein
MVGLVRIDLPALRRGHTEPGELCDIPGVGPIPVAHAREILGDALLRFVITDGHDVRTVAHLSRRASAHQRTALLYRHDECAVTGCTTRLALQHDHDDPWARTHETWLPNLKAVCPHHHHRLVPPHHPDHPTNTGAVKPTPPQRTAPAMTGVQRRGARRDRAAPSVQLPLDRDAADPNEPRWTEPVEQVPDRTSARS